MINAIQPVGNANAASTLQRIRKTDPNARWPNAGVLTHANPGDDLNGEQTQTDVITTTTTTTTTADIPSSPLSQPADSDIMRVFSDSTSDSDSALNSISDSIFASSSITTAGTNWVW